MRLPSAQRFLKDSVWNLVGQALPLGVGLVTIPILLQSLGSDRFGILSLTWVLIGYMSLFDFGVGRALTRFVAEADAKGETERAPDVARTGLLLIAVLGVVGALIVAGIAPLALRGALKVPEALLPETRASIRIMALAIPMALVTAGLRGLLEAKGAFRVANLLRVSLGVWMFVGPVLLLPLTSSLAWLVAMIVFGRAVTLVFSWRAVAGTFPALAHGRYDGAQVRSLLTYGGWLTVSNVVSPLMNSMDRFLIGGVLGVGAVAYYVTPYEITSKLAILPVAVTTVLFPVLSGRIHDLEGPRFLRSAFVWDFSLTWPTVMLLVLFANELLTLWVGADVARVGSPVMQWLAIGAFINTKAHYPFTALHALGRPGLTAGFHVLELVIYLPGLWWLVHVYGILGVAIAWTLRVALDDALLFAAAFRLLPAYRGVWREAVVLALLGTLTLATAALINNTWSRLLAMLVAVTVATVMAWHGTRTAATSVQAA